MKVVVTGGTGFLGRHVVWRAAREGADVVFTGRDARAAAQVQAMSPRHVRWAALEHGQPDTQRRLSKICKGADLLIHCAALSAPWGCREDFVRANVHSAAEVRAACEAQGVPRLVHISTPSLYFDFRDRLSIREDAPLPAPCNDYARTKRQAEELLQNSPDQELAILRPRALFGPWDQTLLPRLLRVMQSGSVPLMRGGHALLDLTFIDNAVDAVWLAATRPLPRPVSIWNVTDGEPRTLLSLLTALSREFQLPLRTRALPWPLVSTLARLLEAGHRLGSGKEPALTRYSAGVLAFSQTLNIEAACQELGYTPQIGLDEGLARLARWHKEQTA